MIKNENDKLKTENDGFKRNKTMFFSAVGTPSENTLTREFNMIEEWFEGYDWGDRPIPKPYRNILLTPVCFSPKTDFFNYLKRAKSRGVFDNLMVDSGGFQVLTGSLEKKGINDLDSLEKINLEFYHENDFADLYMMPDHPPSKNDQYDTVFKDKISRTVDYSLRFFDNLEPHLKQKAVPILHLRYDVDIEKQLEMYKPITDCSRYVAYSASAMTPAGYARHLKHDVLTMVKTLQERLDQDGIQLHCLGLGSTIAAFKLNYLGVRSFDASTAIMIAGLGQVLFPYYPSLPCSVVREDNIKNLNEQNIEVIRKTSNHKCPFCEDVVAMKQPAIEGQISGQTFRRLHNLCVMDDLNWEYNDLNTEKLKEISNSQYKALMNVVDDNQYSLF